MKYEEIAMQITLKAIEAGVIATPIDLSRNDDPGKKSNYNTNLICDCYKMIWNTIQTLGEDESPTE